MLRTRPSIRSERGVSIVLFAILLPVLLALGAVVLDVGNWYVHRRHLQTQVDAAALAGGSQLSGCQEDPSNANGKATQQALLYAGDPTRQPLTRNQQVQVASKVHVVLNSHGFWSSGTALGGAGYTSTPDFTETPDADSPKLGPAGGPCYLGWVDVKATDQNAPKIWGLVPGTTSPKTVARVELDKVLQLTGALPLGLNEVDAEHVYAIVVNEDAPTWQTNPAAVVGSQELMSQNPPPAGLGGFQVYQNTSALTANMNGAQDYGVFILTTYNAAGASMSGSLGTICGQNPSPPAQVQCFAYDGSGQEVSFIHAYSDSSPATAANPQLRQAPISGGGGPSCPNDLSAPYFNLDGGCSMTMSAKVDFGVASNKNPMDEPAKGGVCADVTSNVGTVSYDGGTSSTWDITFTPPDSSNAGGRYPIVLTAITYKVANNNKCNNQTNTSKSLGTAGAPYTTGTNNDSGPIQYLWVTPWGSSAAANSMNQNAGAQLQVTVGFLPKLVDAPITDPPLLFRLGQFNTPSQTQALDCGTGASGFRNAIVNGCPGFVINQRNGICSPSLTPYPDCIDSENGNFTVKSAYQQRFTPDGCAKDPNNWNRNGYTTPPPEDPRWGVLFIMDPNGFSSPGKKTYPIRRFVAVYVTAGDSLSCSGDVPNGTSGVGRNELWGHVVSYVTPDPTAVASQTKCSFTDGNVCVPVLVR